jgi:RNA polymerase sigma factor (sigma-70 family)
MSALQHSLFSSQPVRRPRHLRVGRFDLSTSTQPSCEKKIIPEEWAVIQQAIDGDSAAAEQIFGCHTAMLHRIAFRILHNKEDAEDAVQDSLCKAYAKLQSFQGRASFSTWLTRIVINSALMVRRKRNSRPESLLDEILYARPHQLQREIVDAALDPEQICCGTEGFKCLLDDPQLALIHFEINDLPWFRFLAVQVLLNFPLELFFWQLGGLVQPVLQTQRQQPRWRPAQAKHRSYPAHCPWLRIESVCLIAAPWGFSLRKMD